MGHIVRLRRAEAQAIPADVRLKFSEVSRNRELVAASVLTMREQSVTIDCVSDERLATCPMSRLDAVRLGPVLTARF